jgi:hypothetical protein
MEPTMSTAAKRMCVPALTLALVALSVPLEARAQAPMASGNAFGRCATQSDVVLKIAACTQASTATPYPWILHWVYREMARAQREHGETRQALASYARSLAAHEDPAVRREMESLAPPTQSVARRVQ